MLDQSICHVCGSLVVDKKLHSQWHTEQIVKEGQFVKWGDIGGRKISLENGKAIIGE